MAKKPGNSWQTARSIAVTAQPTSFKGWLNRKDKVDFYSFQLTGSSSFSLTLNGLKANANVALLDKVGKPIAQSVNPKKQSEALNISLNAETYYIRVNLKGKAKTKYQLQVSALLNPPPITKFKFQRLWLKQFGTASLDRGLAIVTGKNQDVYLAGSTQGALQGNNLGSLDAYVTKYNSAGESQWLRQIGTNQADEFADLAIDNADNIYAVGVKSLPTSIIAAFSDAAVVKYGSDGSLLFNQGIGSGNRNDESALGAASSNDGSLYVVGQVTSLNWTNFSVNLDPYLAKYNSSGGLVSQILIDSANQGAATGVTVDAQGNVYVAGITNASTRINSNNTVSLTEGDVFLTKYSNDGQLLWFNTLETSKTDIPGKVLVDISGNIYLAGSTSGSLPGNTNQGDIDAFLAKYSNDGNLQWIQQFGTFSKDTAESIALDATGRIYAVGTTAGSLFGEPTAGGSDAWIALFDHSGNRSAHTQFGTAKDDRLIDIALDQTGNLYLVGETEGDLGGTNQGAVDSWVAKYSLIQS